MKVQARHYRSSGNTSLLNLIIIVLVGALVYLLYTKGRLDSLLPEKYRHAAVAEGGPEEAATPVAAKPLAQTPAEVLAQTPRQFWPKEVAISREMDVEIVREGKVVGAMKARPGTLFEVVQIHGENVVIKVGDGTRTLAAKDTDVLQRIVQRQAAR